MVPPPMPQPHSGEIPLAILPHDEATRQRVRRQARRQKRGPLLTFRKSATFERVRNLLTCGQCQLIFADPVLTPCCTRAMCALCWCACGDKCPACNTVIVEPRAINSSVRLQNLASVVSTTEDRRKQREHQDAFIDATVATASARAVETSDNRVNEGKLSAGEKQLMQVLAHSIMRMSKLPNIDEVRGMILNRFNIMIPHIRAIWIPRRSLLLDVMALQFDYFINLHAPNELLFIVQPAAQAIHPVDSRYHRLLLLHLCSKPVSKAVRYVDLLQPVNVPASSGEDDSAHSGEEDEEASEDEDEEEDEGEEGVPESPQV